MARTLKSKATDEDGDKPRVNFESDKAQSLYERFLALADDFESTAGAYRSDVKELYAEAADKLGIRRTIIRAEFQRTRAEQKRLAREADSEGDEEDQRERLRAALGDFATTPLGEAAR